MKYIHLISETRGLFSSLVLLLYACSSVNLRAQCSNTDFIVSNTKCVSQSITFSNSSGNVGDGSTYEWDFKDGSPVVASVNAVHTFGAVGTYNVVLTRTCPNNEKDTKTIPVIVSAKPTPSDFTFNPNGQCSENSVSFFTTTPQAGFSYSWNFNDALSNSNTSRSRDTTHIFEAYGTGNQNFNVVLTSTDNKGCFASTTKAVAVKQRPDLQVSELNNFKTCISNIAAGVSADVNLFNDTQEPSKSSITNYAINWGDGSAVENRTNALFDNNAGITHNYTVLNRYNITIEATATNGCKTTRVFPYLVDANPVANLVGPPSGTNTGCGPLTVLFTNNSSNVSSTTRFFFTPGDGTAPIELPTGVTGNTISYTYQTSCINGVLQSLTAKLKAENECDSATSTWSPIKVYPQPIADFAAVAPFCKNVPISFINNSIPNRCAANAATRYTWDWGDGTTPQVFNNISAALIPQQTLTHTFPDTGTYRIILRAENNSTNGCGFTTDTLVIRVSDLPTANFTPSQKAGCAPLNVQFANQSKGINVSYSWAVSPATGFTFANGTSATSTNPQINFTNQGSFVVTLTATTPCGISLKRDTIVVKDKPTVIFPVTPAAQCAPATFTEASFMPNIIGNGGTISNYLWNFSGGSTSNSNTATPGAVTYNTPNAYTLSVTVANECGSTAQSATNFFTVGTPPIADAGKDTAICSGNIAMLGTAPLASHTYSWSPTTGLNNPNIANPTTTLTNVSASAQLMVFTLTVTANGCSSTQDVSVTVNPFPTVSAGSDTAICKANLSFALSGATPAGGTWSGGSFISANGVFNATGLNAATYTASYTFKDAATACEATMQKRIVINALPSVEAGNPVSYCNSSTVETLSGFTPTGGSWSGSGVTATGEFTPSVVGIVAGHKLYYTFTDANTCTSKDSLIVTITAPTSVNMGTPETKCINNIPFTLASPTPAGGSWTVQPYLTSNGVFNPKISGSGTFSVTYTSSGTASCQSTGTKDMIITDTIAIEAGADEIVCANQASYTLAGFTPAGGTWSSQPTAFVSGDTFDPTEAGLITTDLTVDLSYTLTEASTNCTSKDSKKIIIKPVPNVDLSLLATTFCTKDTLVDLGALPTGGVWTGDGIIGNQFNPHSAGVGAHSLNYKIITGTCADDEDILVNVSPLVKPDAGSDFQICVDAPIHTLANFNPSGGTWSGAGVSGNSISPSVAGVGIYDLIYTTGLATCRATDSIEVTVNPIPSVDVGTNPQGVCEGAPAFNLAGWSPNTGGTWEWVGTGITDGTLGTFDPSVSGAGVFTLTFTFTNTATGCDESKTKVVNVNALPALSFNMLDSICTGQDFTITNTSTGSNLSNSWSLTPYNGASFILGTDANSTNPIVSFSTANTYELKLIGATGAGCIDSLKKPIVVIAPPVVKFIKDKDQGCGPLTVAFTNQTTGILKSYMWDFGNGQTSTLADPPPVIFAPSKTQDSTYYITLRVTSPTCDDVVYRDSIVVFPKPNVVFGPDKNIGCSVVEIKFKNNTTGRPDTFFWDYGDGTPTSTTALGLHSHYFSYNGTNDTSYVVTLVATNTCGKDTAFQNIKVLPNTVKAFFNTDVFEGCVPLTVNFTNYSTGGNNINWTLGDGNVTSSVSPTHTYMQPGEYFVTLSVNNGCSYDTTKPAVKIRVHPTPLVKFTPIRTIICETNEAFFVDNSADLKSYTWSFGDGGNSTLSNPSHVYPTAGVYKVMLTGQSATTNCIAKDSAEINVSPGPDAQFSTNADVGCQPFTASFTNTSTNSVNFSWVFGDGNTTGDTTSAFDFTFAQAGTFNIKLYSFNALGCVDSTERSILVHPKPLSDFTVSPENSCTYPVKVQTTNRSTGFVTSEWSFANGQISILDNPFTNYSAVGNYEIQLVSTSDKGCKDTAVVVFKGFPMPVPSFTATPVSGCEPLVVSFQNHTSSASQYIWDFGDQSTPSKLQNPVHVYEKEGIYSVKLVATGNDVCTDSASQIDYIEVLKQPNVSFTYQNNNNPVPHGEIQFTNLTDDATSYLWDFGDGDTSTLKDPVHRYAAYGNVLVKLIAKNTLGCSDTTSTLIFVDFYKGLWVPTALTPEYGSAETRLFMPKGKGLKNYKLQIYDNWGIVIWQSDKLDNGSPAEGWDGIGQNGQPMPPDVYVWKVSAEFEDGTLWEGQDLGNNKKTKAIGTVTLLR